MPHDAGAPLERALDQPADRPRIEHVLLREHARRERLLGVVGEHRHDRLADDRPVVEVGGHEVDARAGHLAAGLDARAGACAGPGNVGSSDGWMLTSRPS